MVSSSDGDEDISTEDAWFMVENVDCGQDYLTSSTSQVSFLYINIFHHKWFSRNFKLVKLVVIKISGLQLFKRIESSSRLLRGDLSNLPPQLG